MNPTDVGSVLSSFIYIIQELFNINGSESAKAREAPVTYHDVQLWRAGLRTNSPYYEFQDLEDYFKEQNIEIWRATPHAVDFMVRKKDRRKVREVLRSKGLRPDVIIHDMQKQIEESGDAELTPWNDKALRIGHRLDFKKYPHIDVIHEYYDFLQQNFPKIVQVSNIGKTNQSKPIKLIKISNGNSNNKRVLLTGGHHSREWIGITSALYIVNEIVTKYDQQPNHVKNVDWYIIPLINPDGYDHTINHDRLWRKNRRSFGGCEGVDLNRNYPKNWSVKRVTDTCSIEYAGPDPLSEAETKALDNLVRGMNKKLSAYVDFHSYGQMILYPWAGSHAASDQKQYLQETAAIMANAIDKEMKNTYTRGTPPSLLYAAPGSALDYMHELGSPLSYAIESRDRGRFGFLLPAGEIKETGEELFIAVKAMIQNLR